MPFMFKVAILIEAIGSICAGEWARGRRWFLYFFLIGLRYSRSNLRPFASYSSAFFHFIFLFWNRICPGSSVLGSSSRGLVAPSAGTASSLSSPSVLPTSVTISCLVHSSPCVLHAGIAQSGWPIVKCRYFCVHGYHFFEVRYRLWSRLSLRPHPEVSDHAFVGEWGPVVPHQCVAGRLWLQILDSRGNSRCRVMRCALGDHLYSIDNSAVPVVGAYSRDMGPCIGGRLWCYHTSSTPSGAYLIYMSTVLTPLTCNWLAVIRR